MRPCPRCGGMAKELEITEIGVGVTIFWQCTENFDHNGEERQPLPDHVSVS